MEVKGTLVQHRLSTKCNSQRSNADAQAGDVVQCSITVFSGCPGGNNVVDKQKMLMFELFGAAHCEYVRHVVHAIHTVLVGLAIGIAFSYEVVDNHRFVQHRSYGTAKQLALVVTAFEFAEGMKRYRNNAVNPIETTRGKEFFTQQTTKLFSQT